MNRTDFDLSIYLVTNAEMVPEGLSFLDQVRKAIDNGVTTIQLREKNIETRDFIERASQVHELTKAAGIPLIINDRVDVALAVDAEGVHVGQTDIPVPLVRKLVGEDKIIGVSTGKVEEARQAIKDGADYVGIGIVYDTKTKDHKKIPFGTLGIREILTVLLNEGGADIKTCAIGGVNQTNVQKVLYQGSIPGKKLDGVAIVSCIMAQEDAAEATRVLVEKFHSHAPWLSDDHRADNDFFNNVTEKAKKVADTNPMIHHITNAVVKNFSANVTLAVGASPIMSESYQEFEEFARLPTTGLVLNTGTQSAENFVQMVMAAAKAYNATGNPIVFDPVGCGASEMRKHRTRLFLDAGYYTVIKGNVSEILTVAGEANQMRGVDTGDLSNLTEEAIVAAAKRAALNNRCIVVVTGAVDYIVDGILDGANYYESQPTQRVFKVQGGSSIMGDVTGTGCSLGSAIAAYITTFPATPLEATIAAVHHYKYVGAVAARRSTTPNGISDFGPRPGSFMSNFLDDLYGFRIQESKVGHKIMLGPNPDKTFYTKLESSENGRYPAEVEEIFI
ncbi:hypothetical protein LJB42_003863 [Komagataella kurtzmanii]|nr:hypothetical protein LJB42_003863 [Komagataella kurtzmanii]